MAKISVIVPVYNAAAYLRRCVESLIKQSYQDLEIILVDDGSTDESGALCDLYAEQDPRIRVIHKENGGAASARNAGLDQMSGEYVTFVDADDFVAPQYCQWLLEDLLMYDGDISKCLYHQFSQEQEIPYDDAGTSIQAYDGTPELIFQLASMESLPMKLFRRELFDSIRFPLMHTGEDSWVMMDLLCSRPKVVYDCRRYYYYFVRKDSLTRAPSKKQLDRIRVFDHWLEAAEGFAPENRELLSWVAERWLVECVSTVVSCYPVMTGMERKEHKEKLNRKYLELKEKIRFSRASRMRFWIFRRSVPAYKIIKKMISIN